MVIIMENEAQKYCIPRLKRENNLKRYHCQVYKLTLVNQCCKYSAEQLHTLMLRDAEHNSVSCCTIADEILSLSCSAVQVEQVFLAAESIYHSLPPRI